MNTITSNLKITDIDIAHLQPNPSNPRQNLGDLTELTDSLLSQGIQQPLVVTPADDKGNHTIIMGHRRYAAAQNAKLTTLPCIIKQADNKTQAELMLVENIQRANLTTLEEVTGYAHLLNLGATEEEMARTTGRSRSTVHKRIKASKVDTSRLLDSNQASLDQLCTIADYADHPDLQAQLYRAVGTDDWNSTVNEVKQVITAEKWTQSAKETINNLGLELITGITDKYAKVPGYKVIHRISMPNQLSETLAMLSEKAVSSITAIALIESGNAWERGGIALHKLTPKETKKEGEKNSLKSKNQAQLDERNKKFDHLLAFSKSARQLLKDHIATLATKRLPASKQVDTIASLVLYFQNQKTRNFEAVEPSVDNPWGEGTSIVNPDDKHLGQAAIVLLCDRAVDNICASDWRTDQTLKEIKSLYSIFKKTGYKVSTDEEKALDGQFLNV